MVYAFKDGAHIPKGVDATSTAEALVAIQAKNGMLTPSIVADEIEADPDHRLWDWFTRDPELAIHKCHTVEASYLIRSVVVSDIAPGNTTPVRAFVVTSDDGEQSYNGIVSVLADDDQRRELVARVGKEKSVLDRKFAELLELVALV